MKILTLKDLIDFVKEHESDFPKGLETPIFCGNKAGDSLHEYLTPRTEEIERFEDGEIVESFNAIMLEYPE